MRAPLVAVLAMAACGCVTQGDVSGAGLMLVGDAGDGGNDGEAGSGGDPEPDPDPGPGPAPTPSDAGQDADADAEAGAPDGGADPDPGPGPGPSRDAGPDADADAGDGGGAEAGPGCSGDDGDGTGLASDDGSSGDCCDWPPAQEVSLGPFDVGVEIEMPGSETLCGFVGRPGGAAFRGRVFGALQGLRNQCSVEGSGELSGEAYGRFCGETMTGRIRATGTLSEESCPACEDGMGTCEDPTCRSGDGQIDATFGRGWRFSKELELLRGHLRMSAVGEAGINGTGGLTADIEDEIGGGEAAGEDCPECGNCYQATIQAGATLSVGGTVSGSLFGVGLSGSVTGEGRFWGRAGLTQNVGDGYNFLAWSHDGSDRCGPRACFEVGATASLTIALRGTLGGGGVTGSIGPIFYRCSGEWASGGCNQEPEGDFECTLEIGEGCFESTAVCDEAGYFCGDQPLTCLDRSIDCGECPAGKLCIGPRNRGDDLGIGGSPGSGTSIDSGHQICCRPRTCGDLYPGTGNHDPRLGCVDPLPMFDHRDERLPDSAECGEFVNGCGHWYDQPGMNGGATTISCGDCAHYDDPARGVTNFTCGGGGQPYGRCGCEPRACDDLEPGEAQRCGPLSDGCGGTIDCGPCSEGHPCRDGHCCDRPARTFEEVCGVEWDEGEGRYRHIPGATWRCGSFDDRCGGTIDCPAPPAPYACSGGRVVCPGGSCFPSCDMIRDLCRDGRPTFVDPVSGNLYSCPQWLAECNARGE